MLSLIKIEMVASADLGLEGGAESKALLGYVEFEIPIRCLSGKFT
jgi:hypothetical protein